MTFVPWTSLNHDQWKPCIQVQADLIVDHFIVRSKAPQRNNESKKRQRQEEEAEEGGEEDDAEKGATESDFFAGTTNMDVGGVVGDVVEGDVNMARDVDSLSALSTLSASPAPAPSSSSSATATAATAATASTASTSAAAAAAAAAASIVPWEKTCTETSRSARVVMAKILLKDKKSKSHSSRDRDNHNNASSDSDATDSDYVHSISDTDDTDETDATDDDNKDPSGWTRRLKPRHATSCTSPFLPRLLKDGRSFFPRLLKGGKSKPMLKDRHRVVRRPALHQRMLSIQSEGILTVLVPSPPPPPPLLPASPASPSSPTASKDSPAAIQQVSLQVRLFPGFTRLQFATTVPSVSSSTGTPSMSSSSTVAATQKEEEEEEEGKGNGAYEDEGGGGGLVVRRILVSTISFLVGFFNTPTNHNRVLNRVSTHNLVRVGDKSFLTIHGIKEACGLQFNEQGVRNVESLLLPLLHDWEMGIDLAQLESIAPKVVVKTKTIKQRSNSFWHQLPSSVASAAFAAFSVMTTETDLQEAAAAAAAATVIAGLAVY